MPSDAAVVEVGAAAMGDTEVPEPTNARASSGALAARATDSGTGRRSARTASGSRVDSTHLAWARAAINPICRLRRKAPSTTEGEQLGLDDSETRRVGRSTKPDDDAG
ncbi:hypothetical protein PF008_g12137 [Phytophthora fragariae]|uniref:Uncharacterized protein n=1 Tax=Phytophthora fragariae TaxID=53985 RepID=A0A6G0RNP6_9STRA|nr:hypothetical protein PF008_g12137 [Phytophthora fragariae]